MAASSTVNIALGVAFFGALSFIFGVIAENKKPKWGTPVQMKGYVMCNFPKDSTVALGALSVVALLISAVLGLLSVYFPYNGQRVPKHALFHGTIMRVFFLVATLVTIFAEAMMMWATITEGLHRSWNWHEEMDYKCPTAKTGLFGGAAFLALDASLFWLVCQMLTLNARSDYLDYEEQDNLDYEEQDNMGTYGKVLTTDYAADGAGNP